MAFLPECPPALYPKPLNTGSRPTTPQCNLCLSGNVYIFVYFKLNKKCTKKWGPAFPLRCIKCGNKFWSEGAGNGWHTCLGSGAPGKCLQPSVFPALLFPPNMNIKMPIRKCSGKLRKAITELISQQELIMWASAAPPQCRPVQNEDAKPKRQGRLCGYRDPHSSTLCSCASEPVMTACW